MLSTLVLHAAEAAEPAESFNHWIAGGIALAILLGLLVALVAFAGGREHS